MCFIYIKIADIARKTSLALQSCMIHVLIHHHWHLERRALHHRTCSGAPVRFFSFCSYWLNACMRSVQAHRMLCCERLSLSFHLLRFRPSLRRVHGACSYRHDDAICKKCKLSFSPNILHILSPATDSSIWHKASTYLTLHTQSKRLHHIRDLDSQNWE